MKLYLPVSKSCSKMQFDLLKLQTSLVKTKKIFLYFFIFVLFSLLKKFKSIIIVTARKQTTILDLKQNSINCLAIHNIFYFFNVLLRKSNLNWSKIGWSFLSISKKKVRFTTVLYNSKVLFCIVNYWKIYFYWYNNLIR